MNNSGPAVLASFANEFKAEIVANALRERGIEVTTSGDFVSGFKAEAPGDVRVLVKEEELERARSLLVEVRKELAQIDWSDVDVGEPESGE